MPTLEHNRLPRVTNVLINKAAGEWRVEVHFANGMVGIGFAIVLTAAMMHAMNDALIKEEQQT